MKILNPFALVFAIMHYKIKKMPEKLFQNKSKDSSIVKV